MDHSLHMCHHRKHHRNLTQIFIITQVKINVCVTPIAMIIGDARKKSIKRYNSAIVSGCSRYNSYFTAMKMGEATKLHKTTKPQTWAHWYPYRVRTKL